MPCNNNCEQGRKCGCGRDRSVDRATVVVATLLLICIVSIGFGLYKLMHRNKGSECEVTLQFKDNVKATYIGRSV
jgi:hypothetical protein